MREGLKSPIRWPIFYLAVAFATALNFWAFSYFIFSGAGFERDFWPDYLIDQLTDELIDTFLTAIAVQFATPITFLLALGSHPIRQFFFASMLSFAQLFVFCFLSMGIQLFFIVLNIYNNLDIKKLMIASAGLIIGVTFFVLLIKIIFAILSIVAPPRPSPYVNRVFD